MNVAFLKMNPSSELPIFQSGARVIFRVINIIRNVIRFVNTETLESMQKVDGWNLKMFIFICRVLIHHMVETPDLCSMYHVKLCDAHEKTTE
ncbi:hypothetical protein ZWY2020_053816 [Hordeum vulgare]|nr:hypothetical protein ZWY2020_053816 [Hordeum vulgare]